MISSFRCGPVIHSPGVRSSVACEIARRRHGLPQFVEITMIHFLQPTQSSRRHMHRSALARFLRQRRRKSRANFAGPVDERFEGNGLFCGLNAIKHGRRRFRRRSAARHTDCPASRRPQQELIERMNCGSSLEYSRSMSCSTFFSPLTSSQGSGQRRA